MDDTIEIQDQKRALFSRLLKEEGGRIYAFALSLAKNEDDAQDLTQEAFRRALRAFGQYDVSKPFHSWVYKILQNIYLDSKRRLSHKNTESLEALFNEDNEAPGEWESQLAARDPQAEAGLLREEAGLQVRAALGKLAGEFRAPLLLCDMHALSYEDIAKMMQIPIGTVRSRIFRARKMLRNSLKQYAEEGLPSEALAKEGKSHEMPTA